tara:strand:- start:3787 stop:4242 length:456 start_codon:yes stop_codon:yes gene_type:complete
MFWDKSWENAPLVCKICLESWKYYNSDWTIIELDDTNISRWVDKDILSIPYFDMTNSYAPKSDVIIINLSFDLNSHHNTDMNEVINNKYIPLFKLTYKGYEDINVIFENSLLYKFITMIQLSSDKISIELNVVEEEIISIVEEPEPDIIKF